MKRFWFIAGLAFLPQVVPILAQTHALQSTALSLQVRDVPLREALQQITAQTGIDIVYSDDLVEGLRASCEITRGTVALALKRLLKNTEIDYLFTPEGQIVLLNKKQAALHKGALRGFVKDQATGETLPYANIIIAGSGLGAAADENGYYVVSKLPAGQYLARTMLLGYETKGQEIVIKGGATVTLDFFLTQTALPFAEVVVTAERESFEPRIETSTMQMSPREITSTPAIIEADVFRALQTLPGVTARTDFSSALYIRGGNPSENIVLLDDVRIYNPYHVGGLFSAFNPDAIKNVEISTGGFSARYGNAVSGVISVTNKDGNSREFAAKGSISLLSSKLTLEHPLPNGSLLLSARRTYFDFVFNQIVRPLAKLQFRVPYHFYDFNGKINYQLTPHSKLTLGGFYSEDVLHHEGQVYSSVSNPGEPPMQRKDITDIRLGNRAATLKWQYLIGTKLLSELIAADSRFRTQLQTNFEFDQANAHDAIHDFTLKHDLTYFLSDRHELKMGWDYQRLVFDLFFRVDEFVWLGYYDAARRKTDSYSAYLQDDWKLSPRWDLQAGLRLTHFGLGKYWSWDPRLGLRYRVHDHLNLKASLGIFHQYFYTFNPEDFDYARVVDLWFPIDRRYQPIRAIHYIAGMEQRLGENYLLSAEAYYKDYDHVLDLNELGQEESALDDFLKGWGNAYGLEFLLRKQRGRLGGLLAYSLAYTARTIETPRPSQQLPGRSDPIDHQTFRPGHDRRHTLTFVASYLPGKNWNMGIRLTYGSGLPETPQLGWKPGYELLPNGDAFGVARRLKAEHNSGRLPSYFRLDVNIARKYVRRSWSYEPYVQIVNVSNHDNIFFYEYRNNAQYDNHGNFIGTQSTRKPIIMFPILPTFGVNFEF